MDKATLAAAAANSAKRRLDLLGVELEFRGEVLRGILTPSDPSTALEAGGLRESATFRIRVPATIQPPPRIKEPWREVATDRTFYTIGCIAANPQNPLAAEHIVGAQLA